MIVMCPSPPAAAARVWATAGIRISVPSLGPVYCVERSVKSGSLVVAQ